MIVSTVFTVSGCRDINDKSHAHAHSGEHAPGATKTITVQDLNFLYFDGQKLDGNYKVVDLDNNEIELQEIFTKSKIVLRIKEEHCSSCVDFMLKQLNDFVDKSNIVVLYAHSSRRTVKLKWMDDKLDFPVYITDRNFDDMFKGGEIYVPYMFVPGPEMIISCFHFPKEGNTEMMKQYLNSVNARLLSGSL